MSKQIKMTKTEQQFNALDLINCQECYQPVLFRDEKCTKCDDSDYWKSLEYKYSEGQINLKFMKYLIKRAPLVNRYKEEIKQQELNFKHTFYIPKRSELYYELHDYLEPIVVENNEEFTQVQQLISH